MRRISMRCETRLSTAVEGLNAIRHSAEVRERQQQENEGQHEEMVSRLKIRLSRTMRIVEEEGGENSDLNLKSLNHDHGTYGGSARLQRIIHQRR